MRNSFFSATVIFLVGCTTASKDIRPSYVPTNQYGSYDCAQLQAESSLVLTRVKQLGVQLDKAAENDTAIAVAGAILFWPALFALGGNKQQEAEYAKLKGSFQTIHTTAIQKKCDYATPKDIASTTTSTAPASVPAPAPAVSVTADTDFAKIDDVQAVPLLSPKGREAYVNWLSKPLPRAFVIGPDGSATWTAGAYQPKSADDPADATERALARCEKRVGKPCKVYASDRRVVWVP
jgi:hypothetical protein